MLLNLPAFMLDKYLSCLFYLSMPSRRFGNTKGLKTLLGFLHKLCFHLTEEKSVELAEKILGVLKKLTVSQDLLFFPDVRPPVFLSPRL